MANFEKNSEAALAAAKELAKKASSLKLSANNLEQTSNASFKFEDGDKVTIPGQLAQIVPLTDDALAQAKANKRAEGYFAFTAIVTRDEKKIPCRISARQLYTPTVWTDAEPLEGVELTDRQGNPIELFYALRSEAKKRFGEWGAPQTIEGMPFIEKDIEFTVNLADVYLNQYLANEADRNAVPTKHTALIKRENYAVVL